MVRFKIKVKVEHTCDFLPNLSIISSYGIVFRTSISESRIIMLDNHSSSMVDRSGLLTIRSYLKLFWVNNCLWLMEQVF